MEVFWGLRIGVSWPDTESKTSNSLRGPELEVVHQTAKKKKKIKGGLQLYTRDSVTISCM